MNLKIKKSLLAFMSLILFVTTMSLSDTGFLSVKGDENDVRYIIKLNEDLDPI